MRARDKNLTVLSETEWLALYGLPDFDDFQRAEYFALTDAELALVHRRQSLPEQVLYLLQTGYFKAKQAFFSFTLAEVPQEDIDFLVQRYFPDRELDQSARRNITSSATTSPPCSAIASGLTRMPPCSWQKPRRSPCAIWRRRSSSPN